MEPQYIEDRNSKNIKILWKNTVFNLLAATGPAFRGSSKNVIKQKK